MTDSKWMAARPTRMRALDLPLRRLGYRSARAFGSASAAPARRKSLLVDGNNVLYHFYDPLSTAEGDGAVNTSGVDGLVRLLKRMDRTHGPEHICVFFDSPKRPTARRLLSPTYKATRRPMPTSLRPQFAHAKEVLGQASVHCFEFPGFEADDLIASYAHALSAAGQDLIIVSNDNDFLQLVRDADVESKEGAAPTSSDGQGGSVRSAAAMAATAVELYQPSKRRYQRERGLTGRFGLRPRLLPDMYALCGDRWGKIPRAVDVSAKRAVELLNEFGGLFPLLRQLDAVADAELRRALKHGIGAIETGHRLARLRNDVSLPVAVAELEHPRLDCLVEPL